MATKLLEILVLSIFLFNFVSSDIFDKIFQHDADPCKESCAKTYAPHTYERNIVDCCERGCRLFAMMEFIHDDVNKTTDACLKSCGEAYSNEDERKGCNLGCKSQKPFCPDEKQEEEDPLGPSMHFTMYPLVMMHRIYSDMIGHFVGQRTYSLSVYMSDDNGGVFVVKSAPSMEIVNFGSDGEDGPGDDDYKTSSYLETNIEPMDNSATPIGKHSQLRAHAGYDDGLGLSARDLNTGRSRASKEATDWLSCIAQKSGLPRLLLSWLLLMCAIVMIWLCLSAAVTSPDHRVISEPQKLSINGDQEVIAELLAQGIKPSYPQEIGQETLLPIKLKVQRI